MLKGHDTLTRLIGKRRKLSLSALSPHKPTRIDVKKEIGEGLSPVAIFVNVKDERVEIRCSSNSSVDEKADTDADVLADAASASSCKVEQILVKSETEVSAGWSQSLNYARSTSDNYGFSLHGGATEFKRKTKQATLSRFFSSGVNKLLNASSSVQGQTFIEEDKATSHVTIKFEDIVADRILKPPPSSHSRLKLNKVKTDSKHEIDSRGTRNISWVDLSGNYVVHGAVASTSLMPNGRETTGSKTPPQLPRDPSEDCCGIPVDYSKDHKENCPFYPSAEPVCECLCHLPTRNTEDLSTDQMTASKSDIDEVRCGRDPAKDKAIPRASLPPTDAQNVSQSTSLLSQIGRSSLVGVLETRIVGRRYNRGGSCEDGMKVTVLREPENPVDPNAIKIVPLEYPLGPALGHLPKEISAPLSSLLDKGLVLVQGSVIRVPEEIYGDVPLKLSFESTNGCADLSLHDGAAESWQRTVSAAERSSLQSIRVRAAKYQQNFFAMLQTVSERDSHLFTGEEKDYLEGVVQMCSTLELVFHRVQVLGFGFRVFLTKM